MNPRSATAPGSEGLYQADHGFGAGVLISALSFDLVEEGVDKATGHGWAVAGLFAGCLVFVFGDRVIDRLGGGDRRDATGDQAGGSSLAIVLVRCSTDPRVDA